MYTPPFIVSPDAINRIADISRLIERYAIRMEQEDALLLRKANKIKTIHSSLAIEGNTLGEEQVLDIMNGKTIVAPLRQIQEVKNAIATYEMFSRLDAFNEKDLLKAHGIMMQSLVDNAGRYRNCGVGVFSDRGCVHMAPPADRVPMLMGDLFDWLKHSRDHLLIRSCVFHYEFEFIHPFMDGNGRMGRLWQSLILSKLNPVFEHLPVENMVYANQQQYYDAISASTNAGQSGFFIDFMLAELQKALEKHKGEVQQEVPNKIPNKVPGKLRRAYPSVSDSAWDLYALLKEDGTLTSSRLGDLLCVSERMVRKYISQLKASGLLLRVGSNKKGRWMVSK